MLWAWVFSLGDAYIASDMYIASSKWLRSIESVLISKLLLVPLIGKWEKKSEAIAKVRVENRNMSSQNFKTAFSNH